jgi:hypothetical protein
MARKGFTRCKFCNKVIVFNGLAEWVHTTRTKPHKFYCCNVYLAKAKKLGLVMRSYGVMSIAQAEPKTTTTTENAS